ncbi:MAG TPA: TonB-dependent receptor [Terriglobales bacterium]|nr:TonB-dependent receptor [Terriglobales bacterium]
MAFPIIRSKMQAVILVCMIAASWSLPVRAQLAGATLSGVVNDSSGAVVVDAAVLIKNTATGTVRQVTTNADGFYSAPNLLPGMYNVTVRAKGFSTAVQTGLNLTVGAQQALNFTMKLGEITQTVEVNAATPAVDTLSSTISATVEEKTVVDLPLNGRDWTQLATLQPGVISVRAQASTGSTANRGNRGFGDQLADSGHRPNENTYRIDGININDYSNGAPGSVLGASLGVDAVQEFNVVTTDYTAEYGRTSGAVINAITKSGTNKFHGDGYFFDRDKIFDARNFFDPSQIPPFRRIQFGGSAGGPIIKDKTFIFGDYEGVRQNQSLTFSDHVPSAAARAGQLCSVPDGSCTPTPVTIDPRVAPFLALWPAGNGALTSGGDTQVLSTSGVKVLTENYFTVRADHKISNSDSLNGSYFFDTAPQSQPDALNNVVHEVFTRRQMFNIEENHIFSPALANFFRLGYSRVVGLVNQPVKAINPAGDNPALAAIPGEFAPLINVPGLTSAGGLGNISFFGHHWNSYQAYDDLFLTKGKNSFKFGFNFERMQYDVLSQVRRNGSFNFPSLAGFLQDLPTNVLLLDPNFRKETGSRDSLFGGYFQDDWKVRPNLSLNLGLRYEFLTLPTEAHNGFGVLPNFFSSTTTPVKTLWATNPTSKNFDPRIGFSWDPTGNGRTAVRAGVGIFDVLPLPYVYTIGNSLTLPFSLQTGASLKNFPGSFPTGALSVIGFDPKKAGARFVDQHPPRSYAMNWNLNVQHEISRNVTAMVGYVGSHTVHEDVTYDDANMVVPAIVDHRAFYPLPVGSGTIANPNVGFIRPIIWDGTASYEGLQSQVQVRTSHGFQGQGVYSYSKCLDDGSGAQLGDPFLNSLSSLQLFAKAQGRHGPCDFDIKHNFSFNTIWTVPSPHIGNAVGAWFTGGWQVGGIFTASTGVPFSLLMGGDPLGQNSTDPLDYPDRNFACNPIAGGVNYLNLNCFSPPMAPAGLSSLCQPFAGIPGSCMNVFGTAGRNELYGPRLVNLDFSIFKNNRIARISEAFNIQFRAEFFNVLNHTNLQAPVDNNVLFDNTGAAVGGAGVIDSTVTPSRQIQFGMKVIW